MYHHMITALESCLANGSNASSQHAANKVNSRSILSNSLVSMAARRYGLNHSTSSIQFSSLSAEALSSQNVLQHANQPITNAIDQLDSHPREYLASSSSSLSLTQSEESLTQSEETLSQQNEINLPNSILPESQTVLELPLLDILKTLIASIRQISSAARFLSTEIPAESHFSSSSTSQVQSLADIDSDSADLRNLRTSLQEMSFTSLNSYNPVSSPSQLATVQSTSESTSSADNSVRQLLQLIRTALQTMPLSRPRQEQIREESAENLSVILEETQEQLTNRPLDTVESLSTAALQSLNIPPIDRITQSTNEDNQIVTAESSDEIPLPNLNESTITVSNALPITDVRQMQSTTETIEPISSLGTCNPSNTMPRQLVQRSRTFSVTMTRPMTSQPQTIVRSNTRITNLRRPEPQRVTEIRTNNSTSDLRNLAPQPAPQRVSELRASISNSALRNIVPQPVPQVASRPSLQRLSPLRENTSNSTRQVQPAPQSALRGNTSNSTRQVQPAPQSALRGNTLNSTRQVQPAPQSALRGNTLNSTRQVQPGPQSALRGNTSNSTRQVQPAPQSALRGNTSNSTRQVQPAPQSALRGNTSNSTRQVQPGPQSTLRATSTSVLRNCVIQQVPQRATVSAITRPRTLSSSPQIRNPIDISARAAGVVKSPLTRQPPSNVTRVSSQSDKTKLCDVCFEKPITHAFVPCGHVSTCEKCCIRISQERKHCVICNARVKTTLKIYFT